VHREIDISSYQTKGEKNDKISLVVARKGIDPGNQQNCHASINISCNVIYESQPSEAMMPKKCIPAK
jgi:hypothetical protein